MDLPQRPGLAPTTSDLGLLQRGRGDGWRRAAESVRRGRDHLLACVADDPRWDRQVEHRARYYATLAIRLSIPATEVCELVDGTEDGWLAESVLEAMAEHGDMVAARLHADVADPEDQPDELQAPRRGPAPLDRAAPLDVVLADAVPPLSMRLIDRLSATTSRAELATLRDAAVRHPNQWAQLLAMRVLGRRGDVARLAAVEEVVASPMVGFEPRMARDYLRELPPEISLPLARRWISAADHRVDAAHDIMSRHAEAQDVPAIRDMLGTADDYGTICSLIDALGRVPEAGPYPELDRIYSHSAYSYARWRAARAMAVATPQFSARGPANACGTVSLRLVRSGCAMPSRRRTLSTDCKVARYGCDLRLYVGRVRCGPVSAASGREIRGIASCLLTCRCYVP